MCVFPKDSELNFNWSLPLPRDHYTSTPRPYEASIWVRTWSLGLGLIFKGAVIVADTWVIASSPQPKFYLSPSEGERTHTHTHTYKLACQNSIDFQIMKSNLFPQEISLKWDSFQTFLISTSPQPYQIDFLKKWYGGYIYIQTTSLVYIYSKMGQNRAWGSFVWPGMAGRDTTEDCLRHQRIYD